MRLTENHGFRIRFETQIRGFHPLVHIMSVDHIMSTTGTDGQVTKSGKKY